MLFRKMYKIKSEDMRRDGSSKDIDSIAERKKLDKEIAETIVLF